MFGSWGGLILQFTITLVVVLVLIAVVYWLVRRYSSGGLGRIGRGRVPRLAVIDAMPVDGRRRLVLVRRDNVEHLILIGGPTDIVVEQAIVRPRQRPAAARPQTSAPPAPAANDPPFEAPFAPENSPIPFPTARPQSAAGAPPPSYRAENPPMAPAASAPPPPAYPPATAQPIERPFSPIRRATATAPRPEPAPAPPPAPTVVQFEPMADTAPLFPELPQAPTYDEAAGTPFSRRAGDLNGSGTHEPEPEPEANPYAAPSPSADETAAKVNDLEREMARLLGEITAKRP
ncbi:MAG: flagellar biosynthetic protein FliO [Bauldia sp.]